MKRTCVILMSVLCLFTVTAGQTSPDKYHEPWKDTTTAFVLDVFAGNYLKCSELAKEPRVAGILHKASENLQHDPRYAERKAECKGIGYKWGSYHLGRYGCPELQADEYINAAKPSDDEVIALDIENTRPRVDMTVEQAVRFIRRVKERTGRYPLLYIPERVRKAILLKYDKNSVFGDTPLWYARYCLDISSFFPTRIWSSYTLLQFASEINCPTNSDTKANCPLSKDHRCPLAAPIPGTDYNMDVNIYYGTVEELKSKWPFTFK